MVSLFLNIKQDHKITRNCDCEIWTDTSISGISWRKCDWNLQLTKKSLLKGFVGMIMQDPGIKLLGM